MTRGVRDAAAIGIEKTRKRSHNLKTVTNLSVSTAVKMCSNPTRAKNPSAIASHVLWLTVSRVPASTAFIMFADADHDAFQLKENNQLIRSEIVRTRAVLRMRSTKKVLIFLAKLEDSAGVIGTAAKTSETALRLLSKRRKSRQSCPARA